MWPRFLVILSRVGFRDSTLKGTYLKMTKWGPRVLFQAKREARIGPAPLGDQCYWIGRRGRSRDPGGERTLRPDTIKPQVGRLIGWLLGFKTGSLFCSPS